MNLKDLQAMINKERRKKDRAIAMRKFAAGMGILIGGIALGVVTGIMIAPKSGKETREDVKKVAANAAHGIKDAVHKGAETVKASFVDEANDVKDAAKDAQSRAENASDSLNNGNKQ